jgi:hypothetical protein
LHGSGERIHHCQATNTGLERFRFSGICVGRGAATLATFDGQMAANASALGVPVAAI